MATTTGGTTYVTSTDLVANYPTASLSLANRVDVVASGGPGLVKTSGYTITVADILGGNKFLYNSASPGTFTLPTSSLVDGMVVNVAQIGAGALTVSGGTIVGTTVTTAQYQGLSFVYVASGTTWYSIAPNATAPGLAIVTPTSIANSGGSASASGGAVTFTGVSSISLNGVFTSASDNYRVVFDYAASADMGLQARLRAAGTDRTGSVYVAERLLADGTGVSANRATQTSFNYIGYGNNTARNNLSFDMFSPAIAANATSFNSNYHYSYNTTVAGLGTGIYTTADANDGITIFPSAGTITGTIRVYGYRN
jgi:hypothetical protein